MHTLPQSIHTWSVGDVALAINAQHRPIRIHYRHRVELHHTTRLVHADRQHNAQLLGNRLARTVSVATSVRKDYVIDAAVLRNLCCHEPGSDGWLGGRRWGVRAEGPPPADPEQIITEI